MILTHLTPTVVRLYDDIALRLADNCTLLLSTPQTVDALITELVKARELLVLQENARTMHSLGTLAPGSTHVRVIPSPSFPEARAAEIARRRREGGSVPEADVLGDDVA